MKRQHHQITKSSNHQIKKPLVYSSLKKEKTTLFTSIDNWLDRNSNILLIIIFGCSILFSLLLFQARMDIGGDDSGYVLRAYEFLHKGAFPTFQGPFYPLFLSIFISFLGINVVFLKLLSVICNFVSLLFLYKAFKGRVPSLVLYSVLFFIAVNAYILGFASQAYSEAFFMALEFIFLFYLFKWLDKIKDNSNVPLKDSWKNWLTLGLIVYLMSTARSVGTMTVIALILYFLMRGQYRYILYFLGAFIVFYLPINLMERVIWHTNIQFGAQNNQYMLKNPYNATEGMENFNGFVIRFLQNCDLYLSKRFFQILGLRSLDATNTITALTFLFVAAFIFCIYRVIKAKNYYLLAASIYALSLTGITFLLLQISWDQPRLIMVYVPIYLMLFVYGLYQVLKKSSWSLQFIGVFLAVIFIISEFSDTIKKAKENLPVLSKNLHGDIYYGFPPGWANYLKLSSWCEGLPKDSLVACRKGPMSSVYCNGREFFNVTKTDNIDIDNADSVMNFFKKEHIRYILLGKINMGNTIERLIYPVAKQYPQKLKFIRQEGTTDEAQLYEIIY